MTRYCTKCGAINDETAQFCTICQAPLSPVDPGYQPMQSVHPGALTDWKALGGDKKIVAGILAILVGSLGVHKFSLGYTTEAAPTLSSVFIPFTATSANSLNGSTLTSLGNGHLLDSGLLPLTRPLANRCWDR